MKVVVPGDDGQFLLYGLLPDFTIIGIFKTSKGREGYVLLEAVCAEGRTIASLANERRFGNRKTIAKKLRATIDELGRHYAMWGTATGRRAIQGVEYV